MNENTKERVIGDLLVALLDDEDGICERGYDALIDLIEQEFPKKPERIANILRCVDATDGRFYLPEGFKEEQ